MKHLTVGSVFAGIGGFDLGFERAGMECAWQIEKDDRALSVLAHHWPNVQRYTDVRDCGKHNLSTVDILCGGFPCQDVSLAGRRQGLAGKRSGLWFEFHRIIKELNPQWVVIENVTGLLSSNGGRDMGAILGGLADGGYWWAYRVLDSQFFGVPQRRRRVFIVGCTRAGCAQEILFERESSPWDTAPRRETGAGIAASLTSGTSASRGVNRPGRRREDDLNLVAYALSTRPGERLSAEDNYVAFDPCMAGSERTFIHRSNNQAQLNTRPDAIAFTERTRSDGRNLEIQEGLAYALTNPGSGGRTHSRQIMDRTGARRLTPVECERLQAFPDGWTDVSGTSDSARYRQLGNAVTVTVAEWIGGRLQTL